MDGTGIFRSIMRAGILASERASTERHRNSIPRESIAENEVPLLLVPAAPGPRAGTHDIVRAPDVNKPADGSGRASDRELVETVSRFEQDIAQKDELISALVRELEQAVEQLDRNQRTGADRSRGGHVPPSTNPVTDFIETQFPFMDDLRRLVEQWDEMQPGSVLHRIESQLAVVHDLVADIHGGDRSEVNEANRRGRVLQNPGESASHDELETSELPPETPSEWEAIKGKMLEEDAPAPSADADKEESEMLAVLSEMTLPQDINLDDAGIDDMKSAIIDRDAYIIQLNRLFRTRNTLSIPMDWATLGNVPAEMQVRVETLIDRLDVQVRLGEVEMSLERARLARERTQMQSEREFISKQLRRLGLNSLAELDNISAATGTATDRRWMRFLGHNKK
jgi:hypothetical protein